MSPISGREYRATGLMEGLDYQFRVFAENSAGLSSPLATQANLP